MSRVVRYKGTLKIVPKLNNETIEEQCKRILKERLDNDELPSYHETYQEWLLDVFYDDEYYIKDNILYEIHKEELECCDIFEGNFNKDGDIDFHTMYYNGGCCLTEALDEIMNKLIENEVK